MERMRPKRLGVLGAAVLALLLAVPLAAADEISREEYVARVEPICKANVEANKRIFKGAKAQVKAGKLKLASKHFFRAATAFAATIVRIEAVPRPDADEAKLAKWFRYLRAEKTLIQKIGRALAAGDKHRASSYAVDLNHNSTLANNTVLGFGFDYCRIDPSRFSAA
jgi:hypothetical protein